MNTEMKIAMRNKAFGKPLDRRAFLTLMGLGATALVVGDARAKEKKAASKKPNIIVILADDMGYADIGVHGCKDIPTPNIDSLAAAGVRFTDGHVSCPVCSPTRAGLMTGRYQQRFGHWYNPGPITDADTKVGLPLDQITIADLLKKSGYATGLVGKWHLGLGPEFHPMKRGFDEFFGFPHGSHSYTDATGDKRNPIMRGTEPVDEKEYLTDAFTREAVAFVERHREAPFFLYLAYNAVHSPLQAPKKYLDRFEDIADKKRRTYAAMLSAMDDGIGAVLGALDKAGVADNTLVFFLSDNGGPLAGNGSNNDPLSGAKGTVQEGGIRVPFIMRWPRCLPKGKTYAEPVISLDILATSVAAAGGEVPADRVMDGVNLIPFVTGKKKREPHKNLFWAYQESAVIREGKWKLIKRPGGSLNLYDLSKDIAEKTDVAKDNPKVVEKLSGALAEWESQLKPPLWKGAPRKPGARKGKKPRLGGARPKK